MAPGRRSLTQTIGAAPGPGAEPASELPYRSQMEAAFGEDFSGVSVTHTSRDALGGSAGMAAGESVAFAGQPSQHTVAHELAHVVQFRQGLTGGEALADDGDSPLDKLADKIADSASGYHTSKAKLPRPLLIEIIGDRFSISYEASATNALVFKVKYVGPFEVAGDQVKDRTIEISTPRADGHWGVPLDVSVLSVHQRGVVFDLSGGGVELADLTFDSKPHESDGDARSHLLHTRTGNQAGASKRAIFRFDVLLPSAERPAPAGVDPQELEREKTSSALVMLGPDPYHLVARRFGQSKKVHLHFESAGSLGEDDPDTGDLLVPIASQEGPVVVDILSQALGVITVDLDGDGQMDARLVYTSAADDLNPDGSQDHFHTVDAFDRDKVKIGHAYFKVRGAAWEVPAAIDSNQNPAPEGAEIPAGRAPEQGNLPTEGSQPIRLDGGSDWELRLDADGDRQKELLLRFHHADYHQPVKITAIQVSTGEASCFQVATFDNQSPLFLDPVVTCAADGIHATEVELFSSRGYRTRVVIDPPVEDAEGRSYTFGLFSPAEEVTHTARFPKETLTGNLLATGATEEKTVAGIRSLTARFGELGDPFLFTLEHAPGGLVLGIAGLDPDGAPAATSGHRLHDMEVSGLKLVAVTATQVGIDLDGDDKADVVIHDAIGQEVGVHHSRSLMVARYHRMRLSGPAVADGGSGARFELRGRRFLPTTGEGEVDREGAGAASTVTAIDQQRKEGSDVDQLILRYRTGVSAQILRAGEKGLLSAEMVSAWSSLSEEMIRLGAFAAAEPDKRAALAASEAEVRKNAAAHAETLYAELEAGAGGEKGRETEEGSGTWTNPYTGAPLDEDHETLEHGMKGPSTFSQLEPGPAASLGAAIAGGEDFLAGLLWYQLQDGVERWAQTRLQRELGSDDPTVMQGRYMNAMAGALTEIRSKPRLMRVFATFIPDDGYREEEGFVPSLPLQLWVWQDDDGGTWHIRDLTNPEKPFDGSADPEYTRNCNPAVDRPPELPPHSLFRQLDDKKKYPKGLIRYQIPGPEWNWSNQVVCHAQMKWYEWAQWAGLGLALVGLTLATAGAAGGVAAAIGSYALAASAVAGAVGAAGELADAAEHGWLDGMLLTVNLLQIVSGLASAGSIIAGNLVRGARAASDAVKAGEKGAQLWTGDLARLAAMGGKVFVPMTKGAIAADVTSVVVMAADLKNKLDEIDAALPEGSERDQAKVKLLAMFALTGGLTILSVKGDLPALEQGKASVILDTVNGVPVAHAGGVRAGGVEIDVSPRIGPDGKPVVDANLHASARWNSGELNASGFTPEEMPWYRAWMEQDRKVSFNRNGEPEIEPPRIDGQKMPDGLEKKLADMVRTSDLAVFDAAWARTAELDAVREANGGHLDIDPSSPAWPTERQKLLDKLTRSIGSKKKAEEMLSRYEALRTGRFGPGEALHAEQATRLGQILPPGEIDAIRRLYPECEVYLSGNPVSQGAAAAVTTIDVTVVVPRGTTPDLMGAMETRAGSLSLRPDPDYLAAHALGTGGTIGVRVKAVTPEQLFGLATVRVGDGPPLELHRLDVPTGPGGQPYAAADLDAMNKAGYEYDPASGQFAPRSAVTRAGLAGTAFGAVRGANTICGGPLPSEAIGQEVLRKLALGDAEALRVVGVEAEAGFDSRVIEWGLGQRESDGAWVLVRGSAGSVDWGKIPGVKARGHSHPIVDPFTGKPRPLTGDDGSDSISLDDLLVGKGGYSLMYLAPSASDLAFTGREGRHLVVTPYVHLGGGRIGTPQPGGLDPVVEFDILSSTAEGVWMGAIVAYRARVKIRAGDQVLFEGDLWGMQTGAGSHVQFDRPDNLKALPDDFEVGRWNTRKDVDDVGGVTGAGSARLLQRLRRVGLPDITDPLMAQLMARMDDVTEAHFHHLLDLQERGRVVGIARWYRGVEIDSSPTRVGNMLAEVRQNSLMADEKPGATINLDADGRAPNKHQQKADGTWEEVLDSRGRTQKDKSFDSEIGYGDDGVARSVEIKTVNAPVKEPDDLGNALTETARKVTSRAANKPGLEISGRKELRVEIELFHGEVADPKSDKKLVYDGAGKISTTDLDGNLRHFKDGRPNVVSLYDQIAWYLGRNASAALLDRVTLADRTGILAQYDNVGGSFVRVQ